MPPTPPTPSSPSRGSGAKAKVTARFQGQVHMAAAPSEKLPPPPSTEAPVATDASGSDRTASVEQPQNTSSSPSSQSPSTSLQQQQHNEASHDMAASIVDDTNSNSHEQGGEDTANRTRPQQPNHVEPISASCISSSDTDEEEHDMGRRRNRSSLDAETTNTKAAASSLLGVLTDELEDVASTSDTNTSFPSHDSLLNNNNRAASPQLTGLQQALSNQGKQSSQSRLLHRLGSIRRFSMSPPPNDGYWNRPVSFRHPRTVVRKCRLAAGCIVEHPTLQMCVIGLIVLNAIWMGIATFDFVTENPAVNSVFENVDVVFLTLFTVELGLQMLYRGHTLFFDGWLVFDLVIVVASWSLESLRIVRCFRIFRALRLVGRIGALRELIGAVVQVLPRMYAIMMLLVLVFYIYSVLFVSLFGEDHHEYFGTLDRSFFTCMELMTLEWAGLAREVMDNYWWAWMPFLSFISITGFIVFNLIVAVVCDAVSVTEKESRQEQQAKEKEEEAGPEPETPEVRLHELSARVCLLQSQHEAMQETLQSLTGEIQQSLGLAKNQEAEEIWLGKYDGATILTNA